MNEAKRAAERAVIGQERSAPGVGRAGERGNDPTDERAVIGQVLDRAKAELRVKEVFTTGEVADICQISQQTVIRCFDNGKLKGFRVPGSKFRRIPRDELLTFMKSNNIPLERLDSGKRRVLIVDDDPAIVEMLVDLLGRDGRFDVRSAATGFDAGALTKEFRPDIMILDYMLPDINGNKVCERIRSDPDVADMRIIVVSGAVNPSEVDGLMKAGANEFIKKPFDVDHLIGRMVELLKTA